MVLKKDSSLFLVVRIRDSIASVILNIMQFYMCLCVLLSIEMPVNGTEL